MNCKQGDLAIVVRVIPVYNQYRNKTGHIDARGAIIRCSKLDTSGDGSPMWEPEKPLPVKVTMFYGTEDGFLTGIGDEYLKPIGNPGEDAEDESHAWLPALPTREVSHA